MTDIDDDRDSDDGEAIEVVSKFKTVQHKLLPVNLPLHPLWHYYEVATVMCSGRSIPIIMYVHRKMSRRC